MTFPSPAVTTCILCIFSQLNYNDMKDSVFLDHNLNKCRPSVFSRLKTYMPDDKCSREQWKKIVQCEMHGELMGLRVYMYYLICGCIVPSETVALSWTWLKHAYTAYMQLNLYVPRPHNKQFDVYDIGVQAVRSLFDASEASTLAMQRNIVHLLSTKISALFHHWLNELKQHMDKLGAFKDESTWSNSSSRQNACDAAMCCVTGIKHTLRHLSFLRHNVALIQSYLEKQKFDKHVIHTKHSTRSHTCVKTRTKRAAAKAKATKEYSRCET